MKTPRSFLVKSKAMLWVKSVRRTDEIFALAKVKYFPSENVNDSSMPFGRAITTPNGLWLSLMQIKEPQKHKELKWVSLDDLSINWTPKNKEALLKYQNRINKIIKTTL